LTQSGKDDMLVDGPVASADLIRRILAGEPGPPRDIVVLNAAAALLTAGKEPDPQACAQAASDAIDSGAARDLLTRLGEASNAS
ncbi:MAG: anthranilate phosphoribosyltransferase, partial [Pirellulales bacterium]|nr:anthranilate phosphoribosyltransferase [Pirellulales bacterium]